MKEILVTIQCITFNQVHYLAQTLEGFLGQQTDFGVEIIVHDDASTDGTTELLQRYAAQYPDILQAEGNGAIIPMAYADGYGAAVAYKGRDYRAFTMGFPFECIKSKSLQVAIMKGIMNYLINN